MHEGGSHGRSLLGGVRGFLALQAICFTVVDAAEMLPDADVREAYERITLSDREAERAAIAKAPLLRDLVAKAEVPNYAGWRDHKPARNTTVSLKRRTSSVPPYARRLAPPPKTLNVRDASNLKTRQPVLPSLFMPGFPKCATTMLYSCISRAFSPQSLGCGVDSTRWSTASCSSRFILPALWTNDGGTFSEKKELFYYGGTNLDTFDPLGRLADLHGPDPLTASATPSGRARRARTPDGLWPWSSSDAPRDSSWWRPGKPANKLARIQSMCANSSATEEGGGRLCSRLDRSGGCHHPACARVTQEAPELRGQFSQHCKWKPGKTDVLGVDELYCIKSQLPWARTDEHSIAIGDFTPNYLCDADAMIRIRDTAPDPRKLRFIVPMRDPIMRAFSEWSMFSLGWNWDSVKRFGPSMANKIRQLQVCNASLFGNASALRDLPVAELATYMRKCFNRGAATMYATTSMYAVCIRHALHLFDREQFLFLRFEDLMRLERDTLLGLIANFTGLSPPPRGVRVKECMRSSGSSKPNSYSATAPDAGEQLEEASSELESFFAPYNALLAEMVHPAFRWRRSDHAMRKLDARERKFADEKFEKNKENIRWKRAKRSVVAAQEKERRKRARSAPRKLHRRLQELLSSMPEGESLDVWPGRLLDRTADPVSPPSEDDDVRMGLE